MSKATTPDAEPAVEHEPVPAPVPYSFACSCGAQSIGTIDAPRIYQDHLDAVAQETS